MPSYGTIGKSCEGTGVILLNVWSGTPVFEKVCESVRLQAINDRKLLVGSPLFSKLPIACIDNSGLRYKIVEVASKLDTPQSIPIIVLDRQEQVIIKKLNSQANGLITVVGLDPERVYTLIALDPDSVYNADVVDLKRPVL